MDVLTHALIGGSAARLITPKKELLPQATLAALGGSMIMDNDSWLYLIDINYYGFYHRVFTHSIAGLAATAVIAATLARLIARVPNWRRFGWFLSPNLPASPVPQVSPWWLLLLVASIGAALHWVGDVITDFGGMELFWPWSRRDYTIGLIGSFNWTIFGITFAYHLLTRELNWPRRKEAMLALAWLTLILLYLTIHHYYGFRGVW